MDEKVEKISEEEFNELISAETKPVLVDFYADWCGPCKMQSPIIDEIAEELGDKVKVVKVDTDKCYGTCIKYNVSSIPTLMLFKDGEMKECSVGLTQKSEISEMIIKYL